MVRLLWLLIAFVRIWALYQSPAQMTEVKVLSAAGPYRPFKVPRQMRTLTDSARPSSVTGTNSTSALTGHWSEIPQHFDFLRILQRPLNRDSLQVTQYHQEASDVCFPDQKGVQQIMSTIGFPHRTSLENSKCKCTIDKEGHQKTSLNADSNRSIYALS